MMTIEQIKSERTKATERLAAVALDLKDDPKDTGAKRERAALKKVLKSLDECEKIVVELAAVKAALAKMA